MQKLAPRLLIFVEGVSENCSPIPNKHWAFWGGALDSAAAAPVRLALPSKLVYSPHVYGPGAGLTALAACTTCALLYADSGGQSACMRCAFHHPQHCPPLRWPVCEPFSACACCNSKVASNAPVLTLCCARARAGTATCTAACAHERECKLLFSCRQVVLLFGPWKAAGARADVFVQPYMKVPDFPNNPDLLNAWETQWAHLASLRGPAVVLGAAPPGSWHSRSTFRAHPKEAIPGLFRLKQHSST